MKYWNKDKRIREKHWHRVERIVVAGWYYQEIKRALQLEASTGKFYLYHAGTYVWFEREQDAMWFRLKYQ